MISIVTGLIGFAIGFAASRLRDYYYLRRTQLDISQAIKR